MDSLKEEFPEKEFPVQLWKCSKCADDVQNVVPNFMLTFRVMDGTGETKFLLFDKLAMEVVNQTAAELVVHHGEIQDPDVLPLALSNICGKTYLFKVSIEKCNTIYHSDTFKVIKIVTQSDIVKEFTETYVSQEKTPDAMKKIGFSSEGSKEIQLMLLDSPCDERTPFSKRMNEDVVETEVQTEHSSVKKRCFG